MSKAEEKPDSTTPATAATTTTTAPGFQSDKVQKNEGEDVDAVTRSETSSVVSSPTTSREPSSSDLKELTNVQSTGKSLHERSRIPSSFYVTVGSILSLQCFGGMWSIDTCQSWLSSIVTSLLKLHDRMAYLRDLCQKVFEGKIDDWAECLRALVAVAVIFSVLYVFVLAPMRAGFWTGRKSRKHLLHRYMGLFFLFQYALAWVEFLTDYEGGGKDSFLPHTIALNGIIQGYSAYFSFKVLPELEDAGYYSDKAVLSRNFVHENIFFTMMTVFGSVYYNEKARVVLQSNIAGRIVEYTYVFWPYVLVRTFFPITRFKNAGTTRKGRTDQNRHFYEVATYMVKIFFLWAKYFLGFYLNFLIFLGLVSEKNWRFLHGLFLLNAGTVSLAMFLHTLRFKRVLPPRFTFTVYLLQIYATFSAIPFAYELFTSHLQLSALALSGLLCNMTRSRKIHAAWCFFAMCLLSTDIISW